VATLLSGVLLGWALARWLASACADRGSPALAEEPSWGRHLALIAGGVAFVVLVVAHALVAPEYRLTYDERAYLMQSQWLRAPHFGAMADSALRPFVQTGFARRARIDRSSSLTTVRPAGAART
jgi:hypothetical protein